MILKFLLITSIPLTNLILLLPKPILERLKITQRFLYVFLGLFMVGFMSWYNLDGIPPVLLILSISLLFLIGEGSRKLITYAIEKNSEYNRAVKDVGMGITFILSFILLPMIYICWTWVQIQIAIGNLDFFN